MDSRSADFLEVMVAIAVVAVAAFVILLISGYARRSPASGGAAVAESPRWIEMILAAVLLVVIGAVMVWQFFPSELLQDAPTDWRGESRSLVFFVVMVVVAVGALVVFLIYQLSRLSPQPATARQVATQTAAEPTVETPSATRLLGLLILALAFLLLNWVYVPRPEQYTLMQAVVYPASFAVALVLLFDKATRAWSVKGMAETMREWLFCDALVILLMLGYLNLLGVDSGENYASLFWDLLHIALFFFTFWMLDRKVSRYRFLIAHAYLILLPILLLIWQLMQGVAQVEGISWWSTIWPFFSLAIIFFVLEVIALVATRDVEKQVVPVIKDAVFLVLYGVLLVIAIPEAAL